ncbi:hypothetical protein [Lysobacter sp. Root690]|uniref:hypothetical protein n=1 Tax=Lysobacter sp. Root690 TaxID=1736588 RepID=UPI000A7B5A89|nr:hypothetical protein [Lysobacter sp. Root690]
MIAIDNPGSDDVTHPIARNRALRAASTIVCLKINKFHAKSSISPVLRDSRSVVRKAFAYRFDQIF